MRQGYSTGYTKKVIRDSDCIEALYSFIRSNQIKSESVRESVRDVVPDHRGRTVCSFFISSAVGINDFEVTSSVTNAELA